MRERDEVEELEETGGRRDGRVEGGEQWCGPEGMSDGDYARGV